jgi:hypothetical protein
MIEAQELSQMEALTHVFETDWDEVERIVNSKVASTPELSKYISENFERLVSWDFPLYAGLNLRIPSKLGKSLPLIFNRVQRYLWRLLLEDIAAGRPIRWYIIKGRQFGCSTFILALFYWLCSFQPNRNALCVAHDDTSVKKFRAKVSFDMHANSQPLLKQETTEDNRDLIHFGIKQTAKNKGRGAGVNSGISFQTANTPSLGRSTTLQYVHLSEFAQWERHGIDPDEALPGVYQAVGRLPGTIVIKETTAKGQGKAKEFWDDPKNGYKKIFLSWLGDESYRSPLAPGETLKLCGAEEIGGQQTRYGNEIEEARLIRAELKFWYPEFTESGIPGASEWLDREILARLKWRRETIDGECLGNKTTFRQEYPSCISHAWTSRSSNCFDELSLEQMRHFVTVEDVISPIECDYIHNPDETDAGRKFKAADYGRVLFFKEPELRTTYCIAADTSLGLSPTSDSSAALVLKVTPDELEEVASFNAIIAPDEFAELLYYLGVIYNTALLGVERKEGAGISINIALAKQLHYERLYYHRDPLSGKPDKLPGFLTNANKSILVVDLAQRIREHSILFRSEGLLDQLSHYVELPNGKLGGAPGYKDDFVSAALIAAHLSTKVHQYPEPKRKLVPGMVGYEALKIARRRGVRVPGL